MVSNEQLGLSAFDLFIVLQEGVRDAWLGHSDGYDLYAWCPLVAVVLQGRSELFIKGIEFINEHFLESVFAAELVDLMTI